MGVRPPQQDDDDGPESIAFGIAELDALLDDASLEYPVSREEVVRALGDPEIDVNARGRSVKLSTVMERVSVREFDSERELHNALHPVFEDYRENATGGVLTSIRSLLPF